MRVIRMGVIRMEEVGKSGEIECGRCESKRYGRNIPVADMRTMKEYGQSKLRESGSSDVV